VCKKAELCRTVARALVPGASRSRCSRARSSFLSSAHKPAAGLRTDPLQRLRPDHYGTGCVPLCLLPAGARHSPRSSTLFLAARDNLRTAVLNRRAAPLWARSTTLAARAPCHVYRACGRWLFLEAHPAHLAHTCVRASAARAGKKFASVRVWSGSIGEVPVRGAEPRL
jgi:hypothetical protein